MSDPAVARWRQCGNVYLWRWLGTKLDCWNMTADDDGCRSLLELIDLMIAARYSAKQTIRLTPPTEDMQNNRDCRIRNVRPRLHLLHPHDSARELWRIQLNERSVSITVGKGKLREFREGVVDISEGRGDWAIYGDEDGPDDQLMYFWWMPGECSIAELYR